MRRLGGNDVKNINIRIIASTNHNLIESLRDGRFRPDLYHRLNEIPIILPPLSERAGDIPELIRYFLTQSGMEFGSNGHNNNLTQLCKVFSEREWPGNVRELRAEINRLYYISHGDLDAILEMLKNGIMPEKELLLQALHQVNWNRSEVSRLLGISEGTVRNRMKKFRIADKSES